MHHLNMAHVQSCTDFLETNSKTDGSSNSVDRCHLGLRDGSDTFLA